MGLHPRRGEGGVFEIWEKSFRGIENFMFNGGEGEKTREGEEGGRES